MPVCVCMCLTCVRVHMLVCVCVCTDVLVAQRDGLHEVQPLGVHLDEGEDVPRLHRLAQRVQAGRRAPGAGGARRLPAGEALVRVFSRDEVLPRLPVGDKQDVRGLVHY